MTTLRELAAPNLNVQPLSITYAELEKPLKLNSGFINLLPKFHGLLGEDPFRHISEFLITCGAMVPEGVAQDQIRLKAFLFSLADKAKDWLYYMPADVLGTVISKLARKFVFTQKGQKTTSDFIIIDQECKPITLTLWDKFATTQGIEIEKALESGTYPTILARRILTTPYQEHVRNKYIKHVLTTNPLQPLSEVKNRTKSK
ncbi:unnamed protein product [Cuscuta campestris]|uniref:Uncharacterized protein n=1 Tax=Cuscuta campestris TaxID=132261 RepID=A0A484LXW1_9ASTE|nr:unnamed protein product [Cuscuta campestris]